MKQHSLVVGMMAWLIIPGTQGCYQQSGNPPIEGSAPDSTQGVVSITGTAFEHRIVLRTPEKVIVLFAAASDSAALTNLAGVETRVRGRMEGGTGIHVQNFTALRVDGAAVVDGVIVEKSGQIFLSTLTGLQRLGNPPLKFRQMISTRVWVGGPLDRGPNNFGVIAVPVSRP